MTRIIALLSVMFGGPIGIGVHSQLRRACSFNPSCSFQISTYKLWMSESSRFGVQTTKTPRSSDNNHDIYSAIRHVAKFCEVLT
jgi:hypothetical protein